MDRKTKKKTILLALGAVVTVVLALSPGIIRTTSTPDFCSGCHVMESQHQEWYRSGLHRSISCVDCHLPNNNLFNHLAWKALDGTKDVISFYGRLYREHITLSSHGRKTVQANCRRCHREMVSRITLEEGRTCWTCHRRTSHTHPVSGLNSL